MRLFSATCNSTLRLVGKTVVITGANTGIGKETARDLYRRGARVIMACRNMEKANAAAEEVKTVPPSKPEREQFQGDPGEVVTCKLNLASFASVRECAKHLIENETNIHMLINNAGVMMCPYEKTEDGFESQFQTNHLGHFLLTLLLLPKLRSSTPGVKIINVSSDAHYFGTIHFDNINLERSYGPIKAYAQSKLANVLFTRELARRLKDAKIEGITVYSLHPGVIATELGRHINTTLFPGVGFMFNKFVRPWSKTPELGAQTTLYCALDEEAAKQSGLFYKECAVTTPSGKARNDERALRLWNESLKFVGLEGHENLAELSAVSTPRALTQANLIASLNPVDFSNRGERNNMFSFSSICNSETRLVGKTVVITGANAGIGKETARDLYRRGARVILACRNVAKGNLAIDDITAASPSRFERKQFLAGPGELEVCELDLSSFSSIRSCAKKLLERESSINILINNAGVATRYFDKTEDGFEYQLQVNYLGHFLFTLLLMPMLKRSTPEVKIINVSSYAHYKGFVNFDDINFEESFTPAKAYSQSKLGAVLFTRELAKRLKEAEVQGISVYCVNPGVVRTDAARHWHTTFSRAGEFLFDKITQPFIKSPELGAQTILHCALDQEAAKQTGLFYRECAVKTPSRNGRNSALAFVFWNSSSKLVGLHGQDNLAKM
ncbi:uncharacterized protein [Venturia canescens]|uniref:uncharacterized protein n=1 Tax=Venturia canescens TaxID=32260 RepID=UPI001C9D5DDE|nr:uncharacterized protein LOC122407973 [Venturia canescens]